MKNRPLLLWLCLTIAVVAPGCLGDNSGSGSSSVGDPSESEDPEAGGSTSAGNPVNTLTFDLAGAVGLAIDNSAPPTLSLEGTGASNLRRVNADNSLSDAVASGAVTVRNFMVAPGNQVFLLLQSPVDGCILVRVDGDTNEATCVDPSISNLVWDTGGFYQHDPIQFDGEGAVYYLFNAVTGNQVLRRNAAEAITDLIDDNIYVQDFLVLQDGTVFLTGQTRSTSARWIRRLSPANALDNIFTSATANFMSLFPDGNVYLGIWATPMYGVARYLTAANDLDDTLWISLDINGLSEPRYYDCTNFVSYCGSMVTGIHRTTDGKVYVIAGTGADGVLVQYYPVVEKPVVSVTKVSVAKGLLTSLLLAGLDDDSVNRLVLYNTNTKAETDLLGGQDIEVYYLNYMTAGDRQIVMFDGRRFADNKYVLCQVDLTAGNLLLCSATGTQRLTDFQLFTE